jgi:hypothetical protein
MRKRLIALAWVHIFIGGVGLAVLAVFVGSFAMAADPEYNDEFAMIGGLLGSLSLFYFAPMFVGGVGLLLRKPWGRALLWIEAAVLALLVPVGTVLAGFTLWALVTTFEVTTDGIARVERVIRNSLRNIVLILIALFILGVIIGVGWLFRDVIDPPGQQVLTPMPSGVPPQLPEQPEFRMPELPRAPGQ